MLFSWKFPCRDPPYSTPPIMLIRPVHLLRVFLLRVLESIFRETPYTIQRTWEFPPLEIKSLLESNPLKSKLLIGGLGVIYRACLTLGQGRGRGARRIIIIIIVIIIAILSLLLLSLLSLSLLLLLLLSSSLLLILLYYCIIIIIITIIIIVLAI